MVDAREVKCPACSSLIAIQRDRLGRWAGTAVGGTVGAGVGYGIAVGLGLAGAVASAPVAIPAGLVGAAAVGILGALGANVAVNDKVLCPKCGVKFKI